MISVIGCGNPSRSDDGAGPQVIRLLMARGRCDGGVRLLDAGTDGMAVMFAARGSNSLIVIDACRSGATPGSVFEVPGAELEQQHAPSLNLHDFRWDHALFAGRKIFGSSFPADVTVLLIEAATIEFGIELSPPVAAAAEKVVERIEQIVRQRASPAEARA